MRWKRKTLPCGEHFGELDIWYTVEANYAIAKHSWHGREGWMYDVYFGPMAEHNFTGDLVGFAPTLAEAKALAKEHNDKRE